MKTLVQEMLDLSMDWICCSISFIERGDAAFANVAAMSNRLAVGRMSWAAKSVVKA